MGKRNTSEPRTGTTRIRHTRSNRKGRETPKRKGPDPELNKDTASRYIAEKPTLPIAKEAAAVCRACDLWRTGTQTVFGEGRRGARVFFVGEQPGDQEDLSGKPFVGPAGRLLDKALAEAGVERRDAYVTNVVKHFKWAPRGKRRIHKKPSAAEIGACRPWLDIELALVGPQVVVCLGATAAQAVLGRAFKVSRRRGEFIEGVMAPVVMATVHPSSILRVPDDESRRAEMRRFVEDLKKVAERLQ